MLARLRRKDEGIVQAATKVAEALSPASTTLGFPADPAGNLRVRARYPRDLSPVKAWNLRRSRGLTLQP